MLRCSHAALQLPDRRSLHRQDSTLHLVPPQAASRREMGKAEVSGFLWSLATAGQVDASTQNQSLAALVCLYREVLAQDSGWLSDLVRAARRTCRRCSRARR